MYNREGGVNPEEDRNKRVMDRINTVNTVWMGLTTACSQCHDHPYDPFTHKEFFEYMAFFNNADEGDEVLKLHGYDKAMAKAGELRKDYHKMVKQDFVQNDFEAWLKTDLKKDPQYKNYTVTHANSSIKATSVLTKRLKTYIRPM